MSFRQQTIHFTY